MKPELLAPAGSPEALTAALDAGANAVYFGLKKLNARRGAENFAPETLAETIAQVHASGAKAYLTLNIQLTQRDIGLAFRTLRCAEDAGVDAVLVTDPALLAVRPYFPNLEFHFSTQAGVSSSAGAKAGKRLGLSRVVVARELSSSEMAACVATGIEIEVFVQGAHCFSCSGRCLLSSWGGGRSGNRGACTSPCRVRWTNQDGTASTPLSMHDMSLLPDLAELENIGIASLKIEGRLKSPRWVHQAVTLYRKALDETEPTDVLLQRSQNLGDYSGRRQSDAFFQGKRDNMTGDSARPASTQRPDMEPADVAQGSIDEPPPHLIMSISQDERGGTIIQLKHGDAEDTLRIPPQRVANPKRALTLDEIVQDALAVVPKGEQPADILYDNDELAQSLLPKHARKAVMECVETFYRLKDKESDGSISKVTLPPQVRALLEQPTKTCPENTLPLGSRHTHIRLRAQQLPRLADKLRTPLMVTVNPTTMDEAKDLLKLIGQYRRQIDVVALPEVVYESQLSVLEAFLAHLPDASLMLEVNSWDTWELTRTLDNPKMAGPGLAVMNSIAAKSLADVGCKLATVSCELDKKQLEELSAAATTPLALTVFSHPKLMITRAILPEGFNPDDKTSFCDSRHLQLHPETDGTVTNLRPVAPLDWRSLRNPAVKAAMLILDITGRDNLPPATVEGASLFNYDRRLR